MKIDRYCTTCVFYNSRNKKCKNPQKKCNIGDYCVERLQDEIEDLKLKLRSKKIENSPDEKILLLYNLANFKNIDFSYYVLHSTPTFDEYSYCLTASLSIDGWWMRFSNVKNGLRIIDKSFVRNIEDCIRIITWFKKQDYKSIDKLSEKEMDDILGIEVGE